MTHRFGPALSGASARQSSERSDGARRTEGTRMALTLSLAESEVSAVIEVEQHLLVRLAAASVEHRPSPSSPSPTGGYATHVVLRLEGSRVRERVEPTFGRVRAGVLRADGQALHSCALPAEFDTPVELELAFANGASLRASARRLVVAFEGDPNFHESLSC